MNTFQDIHTQATVAAKQATQNYLTAYGEPGFCGFAWVDVKVRSNSKLGKAMLAAGFHKSYKSGVLTLWNPSDWAGQSMDVLEAGAQAYAEVLQSHDIKARVGVRPD